MSETIDERAEAAALDTETRHQLRMEAEDFLHAEAELLDDRRLTDWHSEMITEDIEYRVPTRTTRERSADSEFSDKSFFLKEDWSTLEIRCERMENDFAWSEDPPSRCRRLITNVRVQAYDPDEEVIDLKNNQLIFKEISDETEPDLLSMERHDSLRSVDGQWRLSERRVLLDHTVLGTDSLTVIL